MYYIKVSITVEFFKISEQCVNNIVTGVAALRIGLSILGDNILQIVSPFRVGLLLKNNHCYLFYKQKFLFPQKVCNYPKKLMIHELPPFMWKMRNKQSNPST